MANKNNEPKDVMEEVLGGDVVTVVRRSFQSGGKNAHGFIKLDGFRIWFREPSDEDNDAIADAGNAFMEEVQRIAKQSQPGKAPNTGKETPPKLTSKEAKEQSAAALSARKTVFYNLLRKVLVQWELLDDNDEPLPLTPETIEKIPFTIATEIVQKIQQSSSLSFEASDFLASR